MPRTYILQSLILLSTFLSLIQDVVAVDYWVDNSKSLSPACGLSAVTACPSYGTLFGSGCSAAGCGCDSNGCWSEVGGVTGKVNINFVGRSTAYHGNGNGKCLGVGFDRASANAELTVQCTDASGNYTPRACTVDTTGVTLGAQFAALTIGADPTNCNDTMTHYVTVKGFKVLANMSDTGNKEGLRVRSGGNVGRLDHFQIRDNEVTGIFIVGPKTPWGTVVGNTASQAPNNAFGNFWVVDSDNMAIIGNTSGGNTAGYQNAPANNDSITLQNNVRALVDGHVAKGPQTNCLDFGQTSVPPTAADIAKGLPGHPLSDLIVRYSDAYDCGNNRGVGDWTSQNVKVSGDAPSGTPTFNVILYKVISRYTSTTNRNGGIWYTELTKDSDMWYNTVRDVIHDIGDGTRASLIPSSSGSAYGNLPVMYNLVDSSDSVACAYRGPNANPDWDACTLSGGGSGCTSAGCKWVGNGWNFPNLSATSTIMSFNTSNLGSLHFNNDLSRYGGGSDFNHTGSNSKNFRADPRFKNRGGTLFSDYSLTAASTDYLDKGDSFCHATGAASGNTINVVCDGASTDPNHYFPKPGDYYNLANGDCAGRGTRAAGGEANGDKLGCYDIQIEGCSGTGGYGNLPSVRTVTSMTSTSITFSGASCSWAMGAKVHVPWSGAAPDIGAIEYLSGGSQTPSAPSNLRVTP